LSELTIFSVLKVPLGASGTHPFMQTSGTGGVILSATRVISEPDTYKKRRF
jgi:hypothetical protein